MKNANESLERRMSKRTSRASKIATEQATIEARQKAQLEEENLKAAQGPTESLLELRKLVGQLDAADRAHVHEDYKDYSYHPSYTNFKVPYHMLCRERYIHNQVIYEEQFQKEIALLLKTQVSAYEEARLNHHLFITSLWPPLHNRTEVISTQRHFFRMSHKQRSRLNFLMTTKII